MKLKMIIKICLFKSVMRCLVRRYVTAEQRKSENTNITEDDINEVRLYMRENVSKQLYISVQCHQ